MSTHVPLLQQHHLGHVWTQRLAEAILLVLSAIGLFLTVLHLLRHDLEETLLAFGWLFGSAVVYTFGYLWCLPDLLVQSGPEQSRPLRQRWTDFASLSTFLAMLIVVASYARAIWRNQPYVNLPWAIALIVADVWLLAACAVASDRYLSWTMPSGESASISGWRATSRLVVRKVGSWLLSLLGVRRALAIGAVMVLSSLLLTVGGGWLDGNAGYRILSGQESWPMAISLNHYTIARVVARGNQLIYLIGLLVAILALASLVPGRLAKFVHRSRMLQATTAMIDLLQLSWIAFGIQDSEFMLLVAMLVWLVPAAFWLRAAAVGKKDWDHVRLAIMVFYLALFFSGIGFLVVFSYFSPGFGSFVVGMLLMWWGLVQCEEESRRSQLG